MGNTATKEHDVEEEEEYEDDSQYSYFSESDHSVYSYEDESELNSIGRKEEEKEGSKDTVTVDQEEDGNEEDTAKVTENDSNEKTEPEDKTSDAQQENETTKDETIQQDQSRDNLSEEAITTSPGLAHVNLKSLSEDDLQKRLQLIDITRQSILQASEALMMSEDEFPSFYYNNNQSSSDSAWERNTALFLLGVSSELRALRFKMVPSRISESKFWLSIFHLMENVTAVVQTEETVKENRSVEKEPVIDNSSQEPTMTPQTLDKKSQEIQKLKNKLKAAEKELTELKSQSATAKKNSETKISSTERADKGKWIISKESLEFMALDEEVKKQLREGKKKRMQEVMDQMKFILDSDDISSTTGHWEKTGETDYYA